MIPAAPTLEGYIGFCRTIAGITPLVMPSTSTGFEETFCFAKQWVPQDQLQCASPMLYTAAVYNWGVSLLIELQPDQPGQCFFQDLRKTFRTNNFVPGVISSAADQSTSDSLTVGKALSNMSLMDLQRANDPFGRRALGICMEMGSLWGLN